VTAFPEVTLTTARLTFRPLETTDAGALAAAGSDDVTQTWLPLPRPYSEGDALRWISQVAPDRQRSGFGLVRAIDAAGRLAGTIDFKRTEWAAGVTEIGYMA
jgi:ribosomal-protein-serine acetyltransferase